GRLARRGPRPCHGAGRAWVGARYRRAGHRQSGIAAAVGRHAVELVRPAQGRAQFPGSGGGHRAGHRGRHRSGAVHPRRGRQPGHARRRPGRARPAAGRLTMPASALPAGACDCHVHVVGDPRRYPMAADRHYTPGPAGPANLLRHLDGLGLARAVIVQPSIYGTDNRCLLDSLEALQGAGRGVAVLDPDVTPAALADLHACGVRGVRINLESAGRSDPHSIRAALAAWGRRLAPLGWHVQVYASLDAIAAAAPALGALPVPVVLDHFAMIPAGTALADPRVQAVLGLLASGAAYVKLSAPY